MRPSRSDHARRVPTGGRDEGARCGGVAALPAGRGEENERRRTNARTNPRRARRHIVGRSRAGRCLAQRARHQVTSETRPFFIFGATGNRAQVSTATTRDPRAARPRPRSSTRRFSQARAWRTSPRGFERLVEATLAVPARRSRTAGRPPHRATPGSDTTAASNACRPRGALLRLEQRDSNSSSSSSTSRDRKARKRRHSASTSASPRRSADRTRSASAVDDDQRARARAPPVSRSSVRRGPARARRRNTREFFVIEHPKFLSARLFTDSSPLPSLHRRPRREKERPARRNVSSKADGRTRTPRSFRRRRRRRRDSARAYASRARKHSVRDDVAALPRHRVSDRRAKSRRCARRC